MNRRQIIKTLGVSPFAMAAGLPLALAGEKDTVAIPNEDYSETGFIETVSGHSPYTLPRDHKFHGGGIYDTGHIEEWHYVTGFFKDDQTGEELTLFYNLSLIHIS